MASNKFTFVLETAINAFGVRPYVDTRLPLTSPAARVLYQNSFVKVPALWTKDGYTPQWKNLAVVASAVEESDKLSWWDHVLTDLNIPLAILVYDNTCFLKSRIPAGRTSTEIVVEDDLASQLSIRNPSLFTPKSLSAFRSGQLTLADTENEVTRDSFSFHHRYHADLSRALEQAVKSAFMTELSQHPYQLQPAPETSNVYDSVLIVTIAYLSARILEDKGYFGPTQAPTDNVEVLLKRTISKTNGFFKKAFKQLPRVSDQTLQQLAVELGSRVTFSLIDHHDVAELYEKAIRAPLTVPELSPFQMVLPKLQQYYTPIAIAERMLESLPLEQLRPEERRIFDPAAGSGTLLLAASQRLASMIDLPTEEQARNSYLATHVAGNDLDRNANLLTHLRYVLSKETEGKPLPPPESFSADDFENYTKDTVATKARVIVANPPFEEQQNIQRATKFLDLVMDWLSEGDQFAIILPHVFLTGSTHGINKARRRLAERCCLFEVWQLPEGVVGVTARKEVSVVIGCIGSARHRPTVVRSTISGAMVDRAREEGFLAETWIAEIGEKPEHWDALLARPIPLPETVIELTDLYYVFTGVNLDKKYPPVADRIPNVEMKPFWKLSWKEPGRVWADPRNIPREERYIRYGKDYMEGAREKNKHLFEKPKLMVARTVNRNSYDPLSACLDTSGLYPSVNIHCVSVLETNDKSGNDAVDKVSGWSILSNEEKLLWLLGILSSAIACEISLIGRSVRHLTSDLLRRFPLPNNVNVEIISVVRRMLERDQSRQPLPIPDPLRNELNLLVDSAYGNPPHVSSVRTGKTPEYELLRAEALRPTVTITGQVRDFSLSRNEVLLWIQGIDDVQTESWIPMPPELPGWAMNGDIFIASLAVDIKRFSELAARPHALRNFRHTPRPYLTVDELKKRFASSR